MKTKKPKKLNPTAFALGALSLKIEAGQSAPVDFQLTPNGYFSATDGRPFDVPQHSWLINEQTAEEVIKASLAKANSLLVDYEHQTLLKEANGQPAPAAAWFKNLEWRETGLWAVGVTWTEKATAMIASKEYQYISPVFDYDRQTGQVKSIWMAALTNSPALDGMQSLTKLTDTNITQSLIQSLTTLTDLPSTNDQPQESIMDLAKLITLLGLATDATEADVETALKKLQQDNKEGQANIVELTKALPDPKKWIELSVVDGLKETIAVLTKQALPSAVSVVEQAIDDKKLEPAMKDWAIRLGNSDMAALREYIDHSKPIAVLTKTQTDKQKDPTKQLAALSAEQSAVAAAFGVDAKEFQATLKQETGE